MADSYQPDPLLDRGGLRVKAPRRLTPWERVKATFYLTAVVVIVIFLAATVVKLLMQVWS